ncbi:MAG: thioredoxin domain-containing protein [Methylovulum sp.]|nr:thioredoxin domain-containing protein [Methylovulum sp.]
MPSERLAQRPSCDSCKQAMFTGHPSKFSSRNFQFHLENTDIPIVVFFWAPGHESCQTMETAYSQAAARLEPWVRLAKVNTEQEIGIPGLYHIRSIPTLILFKAEREVARQSGIMNAGEIMSWVSKYI